MAEIAGSAAAAAAILPLIETNYALDEHDVAYSLHMYPGTRHGFHNDTSRARYKEAAAKLAWQRTLNFFDHYLGA